jgi:nicotinamidase-related amidase
VPLVDRTDSTLVVVDAQPQFIAQPSMSTEEQAEAAASFERAVWLAGIATLLDIPAVVVEEGPERAGKTEPKLLERLPPGTAVHVKQTFGLVARREIVDAIYATERRTLVLVGFETDTCVAQSAIELHDLGFRVVVAEDAMYSTGALEHQRGLKRMLRAGVEISDCKGVAFEWLRLVDEAIEVVRASAATYGPAPLRL